MIRNIEVHKSARGYHHIISNCNTTNNYSIGSNPYIITDNRRSFLLSTIRLTNTHSICYIKILSYYCPVIYPHITKVADEEAFTYYHFRKYLCMKPVSTSFKE